MPAFLHYKRLKISIRIYRVALLFDYYINACKQAFFIDMKLGPDL